MFAVSLILLVILAVAVAIVLLVALPQLRSGSEILSEDGKQAVARAGQAARTGPIAVVGGTKQLLRPVSEALHAQLDRLDERDSRTSSGPPVGAGRRSPSSSSSASEDADDHPAARHAADHRGHAQPPGGPGERTMLAPRPIPDESGPIPEVARRPEGEPDLVIDLRDPDPAGLNAEIDVANRH